MTPIEMELRSLKQYHHALGTTIQNLEKQLAPKAKKQKALKPEHQEAVDKALRRQERNATKPKK